MIIDNRQDHGLLRLVADCLEVRSGPGANIEPLEGAYADLPQFGGDHVAARPAARTHAGSWFPADRPAGYVVAGKESSFLF